jgi:hypothetical protein
MRGVAVWALVFFVACHKPAAQPQDPLPDAPAVDAAIDAPIDAPQIGMDAPPPLPCTSQQTLLDVSPRQLGGIAVSGNVLYASVYKLEGTTLSETAVLSIDLTTGNEAAPPHVTSAIVTLAAAGDDVYASEHAASGTIWRFRPGTPPTQVITGLSGPRVTTADGDYLYWTEQPASSTTGIVRRRLIAGGPIEDVMSCDGAMRLLVVGDDVFCANTGLTRAPKTGGGAITSIPYAKQGYYITSMVADQSDIYFVNIYNNPQAYRVAAPNGPAVLLKQLETFGRFNGLALSGDHLYAIDQDTGLWRIHRTTGQADRILSTVLLDYDPVIWNGSIYFSSATLTSSGHPLVMHCAL